MSLHAFERRCVCYARLERLEEHLIADCSFAWEGTVTLFPTIPISSQEGLGLVHAKKMCPCYNNIYSDSGSGVNGMSNNIIIGSIKGNYINRSGGGITSNASCC